MESRPKNVCPGSGLGLESWTRAYDLRYGLSLYGVPGEQLHTNVRRCRSSASAVRQSAEVDRSAMSSEQLWSPVLFALVVCPSTWNSLPDSFLDPALSLNMFRCQLKTYFSAKHRRDDCTQRIRDLLRCAI